MNGIALLGEAREVCEKGAISLTVDVNKKMAFGHVETDSKKSLNAEPRKGYRKLSTGKDIRYTPIEELVGR